MAEKDLADNIEAASAAAEAIDTAGATGADAGTAPSPADELEVPRDTLAVIRRMWGTATGEHWRFAVVVACICLYTAASIAAPAYCAYLIDYLWSHIQRAFAAGETFRVTWETGGREVMVFLGIWTVAWIFYTIQSFTMASFAERLNLKLRRELSDKLNRLPLAFYDRRKPARSSAALPTTSTRSPRSCSAASSRCLRP